MIPRLHSWSEKQNPLKAGRIFCFRISSNCFVFCNNFCCAVFFMKFTWFSVWIICWREMHQMCLIAILHDTNQHKFLYQQQTTAVLSCLIQCIHTVFQNHLWFLILDFKLKMIVHLWFDQERKCSHQGWETEEIIQETTIRGQDERTGTQKFCCWDTQKNPLDSSHVQWMETAKEQTSRLCTNQVWFGQNATHWEEATVQCIVSFCEWDHKSEWWGLSTKNIVQDNCLHPNVLGIERPLLEIFWRWTVHWSQVYC